MDPRTVNQLQEWFVMLSAWGLFAWGVYLVTSIVRRKQKNDMQKHMLEKFSSAKDFADFVQSPAGQKYVMSFSESVTDARSTIVNAIRTGIILVFCGAGLMATPRIGIGDSVRSWFEIAGNFLIVVGAGYVIAAVVSYFVAKRMKPEEKE